MLDVLILCLAFALKYMAAFMRATLPPCGFLMRGYLCHACGGTRCVYHFFSGNFGTAFLYNPFVFLMIIYCFIAIVFLNLYCFFEIRFAWRAFRAMTDWKTIIVLAIAFVVFGVVRHFIVM